MAFKRFSGGFNQIVTASSSHGLQMISVRWLILDEVSGYLCDVDGRGSPSSQARARQKAFGDLAKELALSTPGMAGECEISDLYDASDRRRFYIPCPHCGDYGLLKYDKMLAPSPATANRAAFVREGCGGVLEEPHRRPMVTNGRWVLTWVPDGADPTVVPASEIAARAVRPCAGRVAGREPGYAIWAAYSPMENWTDIRKRGQAARADPAMLKLFTQQDQGEPYEPKNDTPDWEKLLARLASGRRSMAGLGADRLYRCPGQPVRVGLVGLGRGVPGWPIDRGVIGFDYNDENGWRAIDALTARKWPTVGGGEIDVLQWGIDTGAFTQALYDRVSRRYALHATKGDNKPRAAPFKRTRQDLRDERGRTIAGRRLNVGFIGTFDLKISVYEGLRSLVAGPDSAGAYRPGTLHLPDWIGEDEMRQLTAEVLIDPRDYEVAANTKRRGALVKTGQAARVAQASASTQRRVGHRRRRPGDGVGMRRGRFGSQRLARAGGRGAWGARAADIVLRAADCASEGVAAGDAAQ
jgi:phage terminase large subunit GpA-like protein